MRHTLYRLIGLDYRFRGRPEGEIFDLVYRGALWGKGDDGFGTSGSGTHSAPLSGYISAVSNFIDNHSIKSVADIGCGDFKVGSQLLSGVDKYRAYDVSKAVLIRNRELWSSPNLTFSELNLCEDDIPKAEVAIARQVLQHLSNECVSRFVDYCNSQKPFKFLVVSEHLPLGKFKANVDKPSGPDIRVSLHSGLDLALAPFHLDFSHAEILHEIEQSHEGVPATIRTVAYSLS